MTTNIELDRSMSTISGKYSKGQFTMEFEVDKDDCSITFSNHEFHDNNDNPIQIQPQVRKKIESDVEEWLRNSDDWQELIAIDYDAYEWHQQNLEDERMGN